MLITLKTLQEDLFTVEVDPLQTVKHFKENIERVKGSAFPAKYTKLMYAGKFLLDTQRVCDYGLEEKKFVILVVKKPRRPVIKEEIPDSTEATATNAASSSASARDARLCSEHEHMVQHIIELGFTRSDVEGALCATFNNPDRAVEYLINGIGQGPSCSQPSTSQSGSQPFASQSSSQPSTNHLRSQPSASQSRSQPSASQFRSQPSAGQSRSQPSAGQSSSQSSPSQSGMPFDPNDISDANFLNHMTRPDPPRNSILPSQERIFELFSEALAECQNHSREQENMEVDHELMSQSFAEMEAAGISDPRGTFANMDAGMSGIPGMSPEDLPNGMFSGTDGMFDIFNDAFSGIGAIGAGTLLDRDHEAIERLKQLGFSDNKVIEAYLVCDRDENAAADFLFSQQSE